MHSDNALLACWMLKGLLRLDSFNNKKTTITTKANSLMTCEGCEFHWASFEMSSFF